MKLKMSGFLDDNELRTFSEFINTHFTAAEVRTKTRRQGHGICSTTKKPPANIRVARRWIQGGCKQDKPTNSITGDGSKENYGKTFFKGARVLSIDR
jgi:hypothetical protein